MASLIVNRLHQQPAGPPKLARLVSVDEAACFARVSRRTMYELIAVHVVKTGHRPGINRRFVDLDSVQELYESEERMREARILMRRRREERRAKKDQEKGNGQA
jgi:hypothetical protein